MARVTIWGDFKANKPERLKLSDSLQSLLNESDINAVNFEAPVRTDAAPIRKSGPNIAQHRESPRWLEAHGFNVVSLANNHTMDFGSAGLEATRCSFESAALLGAGAWEEAYGMQVLTTRDGLRVGFLAATHSEFGTLTDPDQKGIGCAWCGHADFEKKIRERDNVDVLIILNHGGVEYLDMPLPEWRAQYRKWIDLGADAVIASHPHVPQGWETYRGKPICYSLGNFCFQADKVTRQYWNESLCCILDMEDAQSIRMTIRPVRYDPEQGDLADNPSEDFRSHMEQLNTVLQDPAAYMTRVNEQVLKLYRTYSGLATRSGWIASLFSKSFLKGIVEWFRKEHIFNCFNCESHRWAILRAMRLKYGVDTSTLR